MGQPVVHFEIMARDGDAIRGYYHELFGWEYDSDDQLGYSMVRRDEADPGVGGGIGDAPEGYSGHATFYVEVPDVEAALARAESLGGKRMMGPDKVMEGVEIGLFVDPEGRTLGVVKSG
jgi:predicted enzyme related to lactoylglutathione lyase